jgi:glycosyltransferase involved in cell wall biosynthesis
MMRVRQRLVDILREGAFDAAICHMAWVFAIFGPAANRVRVPLIFWMHDAVRRRNWLTRWAGLLVPDLVICNSQFTASTLGRLFARASYETLYYPVARKADSAECTQREVVRNRLDTPCDAVVLMQSSRMEAWKGHDLLLEALARISNVPQWICWIAGGAQRRHEAAYEKCLHARAAALGLKERIRFLGERSDVAQLMAAADIFCPPNRDAEPFGIALIEALYAGLPVVAGAAGGPLEIVDESCGILVQPSNPASLADALQNLIRDEPLRRRLGGAAASRASQLCDPPRQLHRLQSVLQARIRSRAS